MGRPDYEDSVAGGNSDPDEGAGSSIGIVQHGQTGGQILGMVSESASPSLGMLYASQWPRDASDAEHE